MTPTLFPRREFEKAVRLQTILNELMHWVAHDTEFLRETLANTIKVDEFTRNLYNIYERILADGGPAQVKYAHQISKFFFPGFKFSTVIVEHFQFLFLSLFQLYFKCPQHRAQLLYYHPAIAFSV